MQNQLVSSCHCPGDQRLRRAREVAGQCGHDPSAKQDTVESARHYSDYSRLRRDRVITRRCGHDPPAMEDAEGSNHYCARDIRVCAVFE
jgi:hypothetical protein